MNEKDFLGAVAESSKGSVGIIIARRVINGESVWCGLSFGGRLWTSRNPKLLAYSLNEYVAQQVEKKIVDERKAYLDAIRRIRTARSSEGRAAVDAIIECVNDRAAERRDIRKTLPLQEAAKIRTGPVELVSGLTQGQPYESVQTRNLALRQIPDGEKSVASLEVGGG